MYVEGVSVMSMIRGLGKKRGSTI